MQSYKQAQSCQESLQSRTYRLERKRAEYRAQLSSETPQRRSLRLKEQEPVSENYCLMKLKTEGCSD